MSQSEQEWMQYVAGNKNEYVPIALWGVDHWSTFAYLETRMVDYDGVIDNVHMRCNPRLHLSFAHRGSYSSLIEYPTRLKNGEIKNHDDWSCVEDMVAHGLVNAWFEHNKCKVELTLCGKKIANQLRIHKMDGGSFSTFEPKEVVSHAS